MSAVAAPPAGYEEFAVRDARVVAQRMLAAAVRDAMAGGPLHDFAASQPLARALGGRGTAWAAHLPNGVEVVVRHSRHGGLFAGLTGDRFLAPTRAPGELRTALRLSAAGVRTPEVAAYAVYPAGGLFRRSDVATLTVAGADFPAAWRAADDERSRAALIEAAAALLRSLTAAGAVHPDLNLKNVLIGRERGAPVAFVLDVDRVHFRGPSDIVTRLNGERLVRSARKWRDQWGLDLDETTHLARLAEAAGVPADGRHR